MMPIFHGLLDKGPGQDVQQALLFKFSSSAGMVGIKSPIAHVWHQRSGFRFL